MTEKALALLLAEELEWQTHWKPHAAELRRLHALNTELLAALKRIADIQNKDWGGDWEEIEEARSTARAAIAKARKQ
jgi:hypothetical protein